MKILTKRAFSLVIAFALSVSLLVGLKVPALAATVDYVKSGNYIYNWGTRETVATFLSPNAITFYQKNNTSLQQLSALSGSKNESGVPNSALYKKLHEIMESNQKYQTSYSATKDLYKYTDCQDSGRVNSGKISSFYSGTLIGPNWGSSPSWNREHTWPNSKGDRAGNGENDIMMLRPTASSENSSRGNKAYGQSSGYYNPNNESGGRYDLRGDVARIMLYVYVRWECKNCGSYNPNGIFGTGGILESKTVMLNWIKEDPVDTWELGRNDSVESITGTRNIFVDYPELAYTLFGEAVPANLQTPSGSTETPSYKVTATSGNSANGTVTVNGNTITATPAAGYEIAGYNIVSGTATVKQNGNTFTVTASSDVSIIIDFAKALCKHTNKTNVNGTPAGCTTVGYTDGVRCLDCGKLISGHTKIDATGHKYSNSNDTTCNVCGYNKGAPVTSKPISNNPSSKPSIGANTSSTSNTSSTVNSDSQVDSSTISSDIDSNISSTPEDIPTIKPNTSSDIIDNNNNENSESNPIVIPILIVLGICLIGGGIVLVIVLTKKSKNK